MGEVPVVREIIAVSELADAAQYFAIFLRQHKEAGGDLLKHGMPVFFALSSVVMVAAESPPLNLQVAQVWRVKSKLAPVDIMWYNATEKEVAAFWETMVPREQWARMHDHTLMYPLVTVVNGKDHVLFWYRNHFLHDVLKMGVPAVRCFVDPDEKTLPLSESDPPDERARLALGVSHLKGRGTFVQLLYLYMNAAGALQHFQSSSSGTFKDVARAIHSQFFAVQVLEVLKSLSQQDKAMRNEDRYQLSGKALRSFVGERFGEAAAALLEELEAAWLAPPRKGVDMKARLEKVSPAAKEAAGWILKNGSALAVYQPGSRQVDVAQEKKAEDVQRVFAWALRKLQYACAELPSRRSKAPRRRPRRAQNQACIPM
ncbi:hypothetical protein JCM10213_000918 [Rhodosporidiobolus nylandii]